MTPINFAVMLCICNCGQHGGDIHAYVLGGEKRSGPFFSAIEALTALFADIVRQVDMLNQKTAEGIIANGKDVLRVFPLATGMTADKTAYEEARDKLQEKFPALKITIAEIFTEIIASLSEAEVRIEAYHRQEAMVNEAIRVRAAEYKDAVV